MEKVETKIYETIHDPSDLELHEVKSISSNLNYTDEDSDEDLDEIKKDDPFIRSLWNIHKTLSTLRGKCHNLMV